MGKEDLNPPTLTDSTEQGIKRLWLVFLNRGMGCKSMTYAVPRKMIPTNHALKGLTNISMKYFYELVILPPFSIFLIVRFEANKAFDVRFSHN